MARKSSFLQGFEVGQDLYSRGVAQAQSSAQLRLQKDAAEQKKQIFEQEMKEVIYQRKQREIKSQNLTTATGGLQVFTDATKGVDLTKAGNYQIVRDAARVALPLVSMHADIKSRFDSQLAFLSETTSAHAYTQARQNKIAMGGVDAEATLNQSKATAKWLKDFNSINGTNFTSPQLEEARTLNANIGTFESRLTKGLIKRDDPELQSFESMFLGNGTHLGRVFDRASDTHTAKVKDAQTAEDLFKDKARFGQTIAQQNVTHAAFEARMTAGETRRFKMLQEDQQKEILKLYKDARSNKVVAESIDGNLKYNQLKNVVNRASTIKTGPADIAIIQQFMKTLDPRSAVLQGEQESAQAAGGLMQKVIKSVDKLKSGQFLSQEMREDFLSVARWANNASIAAGRAGVEQYSKQTEDVLGGRHEFQSIRDEIGQGDWVYTSKGLYEAAIRQGSLHDGDSFSYPDLDNPGGLISGTYSAPVEQPESPATPAPSVPEGIVYESMDQVNKAIEDEKLNHGDRYNFRKPDGTVLQVYATEDGKPPTGKDNERPGSK